MTSSKIFPFRSFLNLSIKKKNYYNNKTQMSFSYTFKESTNNSTKLNQTLYVTCNTNIDFSNSIYFHIFNSEIWSLFK